MASTRRNSSHRLSSQPARSSSFKGIPALIFWRYFRGRVDEYLLTLELAAERFVRHLNTLRGK